MTEINISSFYNYNKESLAQYLQIVNDNEFKIVIPRNTLKIEPVELTGAVDFDTAAYAGQLLGNIAERFSYYVPCPFTTACFHFIVTIRDMQLFSELLYLVIQVFNSDTTETGLVINFHREAEIFFDKYSNGEVEAATSGLISVANELEDAFEQYCMLPVKTWAVINTAQLQKYSNRDLYIHLLQQRTDHFKIVIPRPADPGLAAHDFMDAAYAGHLLSKTVNNFACFVPSPQSGEPFYFDVTVYSLEKFTDILYQVIQGFNYDNPCCNDFEYEAAMFFGNVCGQEEHCKTRGLHQVALQLLAL